ncbi:EF hand domain containing protein [Nitzschia inconspicua]|uniref:EF hand domain containing protein n=1 Tax=Nitzschia inconspicua TaxID=303405 RepID=A0A9K3Q173_9STRA|nr:EF hand domain containing protein [Nitzschia inconspicua]
MYLQKTLLLSLLVASSHAFSPSMSGNNMKRAPFFVTVVEPETAIVTPAPRSELSAVTLASKSLSPVTNNKKKAIAPAAHGKEGIFSPLVKLSKDILGEKELNQIRAKAIGLHSDVIGKFVDTADSSVGYQVLRALFTVADKNQNGKIEQDELAEALTALGFDLKPKQISGIFERADLDANGALDFEEWRREAPKTLRTNLIKLAKKNGGELGFLV